MAFITWAYLQLEGQSDQNLTFLTSSSTHTFATSETETGTNSVLLHPLSMPDQDSALLRAAHLNISDANVRNSSLWNI